MVAMEADNEQHGSQDEGLNTPCGPYSRLGDDVVIPRNSRGQRIDLPIRTNDQINEIRNQFAKRPQEGKKKLCNNFHLGSECYYQNCMYEHGRLDVQEVTALQLLARELVCERGSACDKWPCFAGHRCMGCPSRRSRIKCRWPPELHISDTEIVNVPEDHPWRKSALKITTETGRKRRGRRGGKANSELCNTVSVIMLSADVPRLELGCSSSPHMLNEAHHIPFWLDRQPVSLSDWLRWTDKGLLEAELI